LRAALCREESFSMTTTTKQLMTMGFLREGRGRLRRDYKTENLSPEADILRRRSLRLAPVEVQTQATSLQPAASGKVVDGHSALTGRSPDSMA
jgi:hypothetical protein